MNHPYTGAYLQAAYALLDRAPSLDDLLACFDGETLHLIRTPRTGESWDTGGISLLVPSAAGLVEVDVIGRKWPETMGDPDTNPDLFQAWTSGSFGLGVFPYSLGMAREHAHEWVEGRSAAARHGAFARCRLRQEGAPDLDARSRVRCVAEKSVRLAQLASALCHFSPAGEALRSFEMLRAELSDARHGSASLWSVWANVRRFDGRARVVVDTIGLAQLGICDHEVVATPGRFESSELSAFLRGAIDNAVARGATPDEREGPRGVRFRGERAEATESPPREVVRWTPAPP